MRVLLGDWDRTIYESHEREFAIAEVFQNPSELIHIFLSNNKIQFWKKNSKLEQIIHLILQQITHRLLLKFVTTSVYWRSKDRSPSQTTFFLLAYHLKDMMYPSMLNAGYPDGVEQKVRFLSFFFYEGRLISNHDCALQVHKGYLTDFSKGNDIIARYIVKNVSTDSIWVCCSWI